MPFGLNGGGAGAGETTSDRLRTCMPGLGGGETGCTECALDACWNDGGGG